METQTTPDMQTRENVSRVAERLARARLQQQADIAEGFLSVVTMPTIDMSSAVTHHFVLPVMKLDVTPPTSHNARVSSLIARLRCRISEAWQEATATDPAR